MNGGYNTQVYHIPMAVESLCQQSMYQQHTYVDRSRMAVTDVYVQEHVSQSSWSINAAPQMRAPVFVQAGRGPYVSNNVAPPPPPPPQAPPQPTQGRYAYMAMPAPSVQYYATSSASMNTYGQMYVQHSSASANMGAYYVPQYHPTHTHTHPPLYTKDTACQTQTIIKSCCDAATQTDIIGDAPPLMKLKQVQVYASDIDNLPASLVAIQQGDRRNSEVTLPMQRLQDITRISLQGSDIAERLANAHRQRPCFKKMDTLCARLKQDLLRPDGVLPNINSQGIAWAVKDFIFVFTRIINSWVILKGYIYNTPEGLNKIKDELPVGFMGAFDCWQISTLTLVEMIIKSFVNLDGMLQKQKNSFTKVDNNNSSSNGNSSDSNSSNKTLNGVDIPLPKNVAGPAPDKVRGPCAYSTPRNAKKKVAGMPDSFIEPPEPLNTTPPVTNLNYLYTMIQDSEEAQRCVNANGTYLKTGTYTPLKRDDQPLEQEQTTPPKSAPNTWKSSSPNQTQISPKQTASQSPEHSRGFLKCPTSKLKTQCRRSDVKSYITPLSLANREMGRKVYDMSSRIMQLQNVDRFFQKQFTLNYYPYFYERCHSEFIDVRAVILKCESATYLHIYQAIHDMRRIIYLVRNDLKDHTNMDLRLYTALYERSVNEMLSKPPYHLQQFDHITGRPGEKLYNTDN